MKTPAFRRYANALLALAFVAAILATGAIGYHLGRQHPAKVNQVWNEIPGAVTVGYSVDADDAIVLYVDGQLIA